MNVCFVLKVLQLKCLNSNNQIELHSLEDTLIGAKLLFRALDGQAHLNMMQESLLRKNIKSIAVIDHWVNYSERFIKNNEEVLPDVIKYQIHAHKQASLCFPNIEIIEQK